MKARTLVWITSVVSVLLMVGCTLTTTLVVEEDYEVRIVNRSGETVKLRWDGDTYRYVENDCTIFISSVDGGHHELEWQVVPSRRRTRPKQVYTLRLEADIDIVFQDDPDTIIIIDQ